MDWSLLGCGKSGHVTYAPAEPGVRKYLSAMSATGQAWRCLRCGAYVPGEPMQTGPADQAPAVRRDREVRSAFILRVFAVERLVRALVAAALAFVVWRFEYARATIQQDFNRERPILRDLFQQFGYNIDNSKLISLIHSVLNLSSTSIRIVAIGLAAYAVIELIEGAGLWLGRRWGEYFAMVATSLGLPYEIYDLSTRATVTAAILFVVNLILVLYLVITKRLFGVRGGKHAYEARLRSESIMEAAIAAAAADAAAADRAGTGPDAAASDPAETRPASVPSGPVSSGPVSSGPVPSGPVAPEPEGSAMDTAS